MTSKQINEIEKAAKEGKRIQFKYHFKAEWMQAEKQTIELLKNGNFDWAGSINEWRIAPEPVTVPLGPEDIDLHRDEFRAKVFSNQFERITAARVNIHGILLNGASTLIPWKDAQEKLERTRDGGKTWHPCSKELKQ